MRLDDDVLKSQDGCTAVARVVEEARELRHPAHARFWIQGLDGVRRKVENTAFPLVGQTGQVLGAVAIFWEIDRT